MRQLLTSNEGKTKRKQAYKMRQFFHSPEKLLLVTSAVFGINASISNVSEFMRKEASKLANGSLDPNPKIRREGSCRENNSKAPENNFQGSERS
jgi:hypothetical protein